MNSSVFNPAQNYGGSHLLVYFAFTMSGKLLCISHSLRLMNNEHSSILLVRVAGELDYFAISIPVVSTLFFHTIPNYQLIKVTVQTIGLSLIRVAEKFNYAISS